MTVGKNKYLQNTYTQTTAVCQMRWITQTQGNGTHVIVFFTVALEIMEFSLTVIVERKGCKWHCEMSSLYRRIKRMLFQQRALDGGEFPLCVEVLLLEARGWLSYEISFSLLQIWLLLQAHDLIFGLDRLVGGAQVQVCWQFLGHCGNIGLDY